MLGSIFLGRRLFTDNNEIVLFMIEAIENPSDGNLDIFNERFPGVVDAAMKAIRSLESKNLLTTKLVYLNGLMQAWCMEGFGNPETGIPHPPSDVFPNMSLFPTKLEP